MPPQTATHHNLNENNLPRWINPICMRAPHAQSFGIVNFLESTMHEGPILFNEAKDLKQSLSPRLRFVGTSLLMVSTSNPAITNS